jgi:adenylylsulfate kinase-like enzyme
MNPAKQIAMNQKLILLRGPAGAGKSTLGEMLKDTLGESWVHLDIDKIKHFISGKSSETRSTIGHNVANYFMEQLFQNGFNVIAEEIFREGYYKQVLEKCKKQNIQTYQFFLSAPLDTLVQRDQDREGKTKGREDVELLHGLIKPLEGEAVLDANTQNQNDLVKTIIEAVTK